MRYLAVLLLVGCATAPTPALAPRPAVVVNANADAVWSAALAAFADQSIPIKSADRASGVITTEEVIVPMAEAPTYADCGRLVGAAVRAGWVQYTALVSGSSVRVTARYRYSDNGACESRGVAETRLETAIRAKAEGR